MKHREKFDDDDRARLNMERSNGRHLCSRAIRNKEIARVEERKTLVCERHERRAIQRNNLVDERSKARERYEQE